MRFPTSPRVRLLRGSPATLIVGSVGALALACNGGQTGDEADGGVAREIRGTAQRLTASAPQAAPAAADGRDFAWRLFGEAASADANTVMSPLSVSVAAAMLSAGARGQTLSEMREALSFSSEGDAFHAAHNGLLQALDSRNRTASEEVNAQTLRLTNDLWLLPELEPSSEFLDVLSAYYGAGVQLTRFDEDPEAARRAINQKVSTDTEELIDELLPRGSIDAAVVMVLTNAIYFKSRWANPFSPDDTEQLPFETASGGSVDAELMRNREIDVEFVINEDYAAVALPYDGGDLELVAMMPASGSYSEFAASLTGARVAAIRDELARGYLDLRFPKFEIEASLPLKAQLMSLGMVQAFTRGQADFGLIADNLYVSDAFHDAVIILDEEGTEAAAATAFVGRATSAPPPPEPLSFDRAFAFYIRDVTTDATLFVGQLVQPE